MLATQAATHDVPSKNFPTGHDVQLVDPVPLHVVQFEWQVMHEPDGISSDIPDGQEVTHVDVAKFLNYPERQFGPHVEFGLLKSPGKQLLQ